MGRVARGSDIVILSPALMVVSSSFFGPAIDVPTSLSGNRWFSIRRRLPMYDASRITSSALTLITMGTGGIPGNGAGGARCPGCS